MKDRIEPADHSAVGQLVNQPEIGQGVDHAHVLAKANGVDLAVHLARLISDANAHGVAATVTGFFQCNGQNFGVIGAQAFTFDELRFHGVLSSGDVEVLSYFCKYMAKAMGSAKVPADIVTGA